jgi:hypothetical protein
MQLISIPGDTQVNVTISHFQSFSDFSKYQDPFYTLLKYIAMVSVLEPHLRIRDIQVAQQAPDCDLALIHDNDLQLCIDGAVCSCIVLTVLSHSRV